MAKNRKLMMAASFFLLAFTPIWAHAYGKSACSSAEACYEQIQAGDSDALEQLTSLAEAGDPEAQYRLGMLYWDGTGVEKDLVKAENWCTMAALQDHIDAQYWLFSHSIDYEYWRIRAMSLLGPAAEQEDAHAQYMMGKFSVFRPGSMRMAESMDWYIRAAQNGSLEAFELVYNYSSRTASSLLKEAPEIFEHIDDPASARVQLLVGQCALGQERYDDALAWLLKAAEQGSSFAASDLGQMYEEGLGVDPDIEAAIRWYQQGNDYYALGRLYDEGAESNPEKAILYYRQAAEEDGSEAVRAALRLGEIYEKGLGVPQNCEEALKWYNEAANARYGLKADAMLKLATFYEQGICVEKDSKQAEQWYDGVKQAAKQSVSMDVRIALGDLYFGQSGEVDCAEAVEEICCMDTFYRGSSEFEALLKKAEDGGCAAEIAMCRGNLSDSDGDIAAAFEYYKKAYDMGNRNARLSLARYYCSEENPSRDMEEGIRLYKELAAEGNVYAEAHLLEIYSAVDEKGLNTRDPEEAARLYQTLAEAGNSDAMQLLARAYLSGTGVPQDDEKAFQWFEQYRNGESYIRYPDGSSDEEQIRWLELLSSHGDIDAQCELGERYLQGDGVLMNTKKGLELLQEAADRGSESAARRFIAYFEQKQFHSQLTFDLLEKFAGEENSWAEIKLAEYYAIGRVTKQDYGKAMALYLSAAEHGSKKAFCNIGFFYEHGYGVEKDPAEALQWYLRANNGLDSDSCGYYAGQLYEKGLGTDVDYRTAMKLYRYSARNSSTRAKDAMAAMARLYEEGLGTVQSPELAQYWYLRADSLSR